MNENTKKIIGILALITAGGVASYEAYKFLTKSSSTSTSTSTSTSESGGSGDFPSLGTGPTSTSTSSTTSTSNIGTLTLNTAEIQGLEVTITGSATGNPSEIEWEWGDGTTSISNFPATHTYTSTGTYDISVIAVYPSGTANASFSVTLTSSTISSSTSTTTNTSTSTSTTSSLTPMISNVSVNNEGVFTVTGSDFGTQSTGNNLLFPITTFRFRCVTESFQAGVYGDAITINVYEWNDTTVEFSLNIDGTDWILPNGAECFISINNSPLYYFTYTGPSLNEPTSSSSQSSQTYSSSSTSSLQPSSGSTSTSGSSGSTGTTSSSTTKTNGIITLSSSTIPLQNGASITISGTDFPPNSSGYVTACENQYYAELAGGIELFGFTADANGNFSKTIYYEFSTSQVSSLANAFKNWNPLYIVAYDYQTGAVSSNVEILTGV